MAQPLSCDFCGAEDAALMMTNLVDGTVVTVGPACLPQFFGGALLGAIGSDGHAGPPTKCQACRRSHERMTTPATPISIPTDEVGILEENSAPAETTAGP